MWTRVRGLLSGLELLFWVLVACCAVMLLVIRFVWILTTDKERE